METAILETETAAEIAADTHEVVAALMEGRKPDPEVVKRVRARGEKATQAIFEQHGVQDIGVGIIRELRGPLPVP